MKINWILIGDRNTPSSRIMGYNIHKWFLNNGIYSYIQADNEPIICDDLDILIIQKRFDNYALSSASRFKGKKQIIYIIDDIYPEGLPIAQIADKVICGSEYIKNWIKQFTSAKLYVIDDAYETPREYHKLTYNLNEPPIAIWIGTLLHFSQAEQVRKLIEDIGYKYITVSATPQATKLWDLNSVWNEWANADIMVIPFLGELPPYELAKGNNRVTQSMILGVPVIASPIPAYLSIIRQGKNGFVTRSNTRKEWEIYLKLLKNWKLREVIGRQARQDVIDHYGIDAIGNKWLEILKD